MVRFNKPLILLVPVAIVAWSLTGDSRWLPLELQMIVRSTSEATHCASSAIRHEQNVQLHSTNTTTIATNMHTNITTHNKLSSGISYEQYLKLHSRNTATKTTIPANEKQACLIHVGKTAGSMVSCVVGNINVPTCLPGSPEAQRYEKFRHHSPLVQQLLKPGAMHNWKHVWSNNCWLSSSQKKTALLVETTRDPLERLQSAFYYEKSLCYRSPPNRHLKGCKDLYEDCYSELEDLVVQGLNSTLEHTRPLPPKTANMTCPERAWGFATGVRQFWESNHHWHNYEYYMTYMILLRGGKVGNDTNWQPIDYAKSTSTFTIQPIMVLRTEFLAQDWNTIDVLLGGNGTMGDLLFHDDNSTRINAMPSKERLSFQGKQYLCRALCLEIQYYKLSLWMAINLKASDIQESMEWLRKSCPEEPNEIRRCDNLLTAGRHKADEKGFLKPGGNNVGHLKPRLIAG